MAMEQENFVALVRAMRELGAVKVKHGEYEVVFASLPKPEPAPKEEPTQPTTPPPQRKSRAQKPDVISAEEERLRQLQEELGV